MNIVPINRWMLGGALLLTGCESTSTSEGEVQPTAQPSPDEGMPLPMVDGEETRVSLDSGLQIRIVAHTLVDQPMWTVISEGLAGPRELAITLQRKEGADPTTLLNGRRLPLKNWGSCLARR